VLQHGILLIEHKPVVEEGWVGKAKGILQILFERGLIVATDYKNMTLDSRKDPETGCIQPGTSLRALLEQCNDFTNELSALQFLGQEIGVLVNATPKYHAELAGEGIEYSWGYSKSVYRHAPLTKKKGRQNFFELVEMCCDPVVHLHKERVRKMAKRARSYICTYHCLDVHNGQADNRQLADQPVDPALAATGSAHTQQQPHNENPLAQKQKLQFIKIEKLMKQFRSHRCALDFDANFVTSLLKEERICDDAIDR